MKLILTLPFSIEEMGKMNLHFFAICEEIKLQVRLPEAHKGKAIECLINLM